MPSWFTAARASLMSASEARVNGAVSEIMEEDGVILDAAAVAVMNVLDNILILPSYFAGEGGSYCQTA